MTTEPEKVEHIKVDFGYLPGITRKSLKYNRESCDGGLLYLINDDCVPFGALECWLGDIEPDKINMCAGQYHAEWLDDAQGSIPNVIPSEWRKFYMVFAGTRWKGRDLKSGDRCTLVPVLVWNGAFEKLGLYFWRLDKIIHAAKVLKDERFKLVRCAVFID